ncbi:uncharacterized protein AB9W97_008177 isoform 2-T3 [Spinachia spinachia]
MRGRGKQKKQNKRWDGHSPPAGDSEARPAETPTGGGPTGPLNVYLGVRVRWSVRDLLIKARGWDFQTCGGSVNGGGPKVPVRAKRRGRNRERSAQSLEDLAMILEVLEEDLWTGAAQRPPARSPQGSLRRSPWSPVSPAWSAVSPGWSQVSSVSPGRSAVSPGWSQVSPVSPGQSAVSPGWSQVSPVSPGQSAVSPGWSQVSPVSPGQSAVSPGWSQVSPVSPARSAVSPGWSQVSSVSPGRSAVSPGWSQVSPVSPGQSAVSPGWSQVSPVSPGQSAVSPGWSQVSPVSPGQSAVSPGWSQVSPVSPGQSAVSPGWSQVSPVSPGQSAVSPGWSQVSPVSPGWSPTGSEYHSDGSSSECPWDPPPLVKPVGAREGGRADAQDQDLDQNVSFLRTQLHWVESRLREVPAGELLTLDHCGRAALHNVARVGKRPLGYAIAKRMAALNILDLKDSDGMTALLHAAQHNHYLMVADLILLGANVNERNNRGKTCLHLSAEKGHVGVLEALKSAMLDGVYVDVEAHDDSGMSVFQCASVALRAAVRKLDTRKLSHATSLHSLRQRQMMETVKCLLQMSSYLHTMGSQRCNLDPVGRPGSLETRQ